MGVRTSRRSILAGPGSSPYISLATRWYDGGMTIVKLQQLLQEGFFGPECHPDMVLSVSTVCSPFRGTQIVYTLGERIDAAPTVRRLSVGSALAKGVHLLCYLSPLISRMIDLRAESRGLSYRETSVASLIRQLWRSDWAESRDALPFDATFEAADDREAGGEGRPHGRTFYRSYVACMTERTDAAALTHTPTVGHLLSGPLFLCSRRMGSFDFSTLRPTPSFLLQPDVPIFGMNFADQKTEKYDLDIEGGIPIRASRLGEEYWANDGVVPVFSQWHPYGCGATQCCHHASEDRDSISFCYEPGIWHVHQLEDASHTSIMPFWWGNQRQQQFWDDFGDWLRHVDASMP
ncbi:hypothetical protein EW146_g2052 [Bondarzewia mesenterica]|uniref:Uncharacterized protein n=1 Tax=Bondarzewia mesenterica TaxID=1095465 RepID=A0A4S4M3D8_9AGAM|nr:hypothetical protein EW146_g2052 [Bondarzewia mesenterica]